MPRIFRYLICLLTLLAGFYHADAQQYPVTASTQIVPPYSVYLPDYAVPGSDKLRVILVQNDLTVPSYDIRLQITVEQNGTVIMRSSPNFIPKPLTLSPGIPTIIGGIDLADYLNPANIQYSGGFSREVYEKTRSLPEGAYRISFTAYDYRRPQVQVSNTGANVFFFRKNDPPLLNLPICNSRVEKLDPQFLTFNWSSRNSPSPLPGSGTEYVFSLYEVRPAGSNPDYIVRSAKPIYTLVTEMNTIVYGPGEPQLRDSMQYVWTVQARDKSGRDMFSNNGLSLSCTFNYLGNNPFTQRNIPKPVLGGRSTGQRSVRFSWPLADAGYQVEAYRLQYRATKTGSTEFDWQTWESAGDTAFTANGLEPGRNYEGRLQWKIEGIYGPLSEVVTLKTDSAKTFVCGDPALMTAPANKDPLASAHVGSIFRVGNYDVILTEVSGSGGKFTGKGRVITLGFGIGLQMEFKDVTVNTDMVVTGGEMHAVTEGIDKFIQDKVDEQHGGNDVGKVKTGDIVPDITTKLKIFSPANIQVDIDAGTITLKDSETGKEEVINYKDKGKTLPLVLEDADGNLYNIDKGGKVTSAGKRDSSLTKEVLESLKTLNLSKGTVTFTGLSGNAYAFDEWNDSYGGKSVLENKYESLADGKYRVSAKAIVPGVQEELVATLKGAGADITSSKLKFVTGKGIVLDSKDLGNCKYAVKVTGGPGGDAQEVYAAYPDGKGGYISMGKLLVASYQPLQKTIVLIPIGEAVVNKDVLLDSLQHIYGKLGITYSVEVDESFKNNRDWDANHDNVLQDKGSAFLSNNFTGEEKALKKLYKKKTKLRDDAVYLFVVDEVALADGDLQGKMPRNSQFGFLFTKGASSESIVRTALHEIGHGDYTLEHTFSEGIGLEKGKTDNLMDYNAGYKLLKYQWDILHDPGSVWGLFEDDADSENYFAVDISKIFLNKDKRTVSFLTPSGTVLSLPWDKLGKVEFQYGAVYKSGSDDLKFGPDLTVGAVRSFEIKDGANGVQRYMYYDNAGDYRAVTGGTVYELESVAADMIDGFIYPLQCDGKMRMYKFTRSSMALHKNGDPIKKFADFAGTFRPFAVNTLMTDPMSFITLSQELPADVNNRCPYCIATTTVSMMKGHCAGAEYLWLDKIAQMRQVYPEYFTRFTQPEIVVEEGITGGRREEKGNWEIPISFEMPLATSGYYASREERATDYPWGKLLADSAEIKTAYTGDKVRFYRKFYTEFANYIATTAIAADNKFWDTLTRRASSYEVFPHVKNEPYIHLQTVAVDKRGIALEILTKTYDNSTTDYPHEDDVYMKLLTSFKGVEDQTALLKYIEDSIMFSNIYNPFNRFLMPAKMQIATMMAYSNMITNTGHCNYLIEEKADKIDNPDGLPQLEGDMLQFKNANVDFPDGNKILINGKPYNYNDIVSVQVVGSFTIKINGADSTFAKGTILNIPAIQVGLMSEINTADVAAKTAWLAFDVGTMVIGVGSAKIFFTAGNYVRKTIVALDLLGSTAGIGLQMLDEDAISPKLRTSLQIASFVCSLPNMALAIPRIERKVTELDALVNTKYGKSGLSAKQLREKAALERIRQELSAAAHLPEVAEDAAEISRRAVTISKDEDVAKVLSWLNTAENADPNIYLAVHAVGGDFKVMHGGKEVIMDHRSLANWILANEELFPANKQLVLLSCGDIETAQHLSRKLKRSVVANDGPVKVYSNGVIEADNSFRYIDEAGNIDNSTSVAVGKQAVPPASDKEVVTLGAKAVKAVTAAELVLEFKRRFGIGSELALKLSRNADFVKAYQNDARILDVIANALPEVEVTIKGKKFGTYREALLTACADDPKLFAKMNATVDEAINVISRAESYADYETFRDLRKAMTEYMEDVAGFNKDFFANAVLNSAVFRYSPLDAGGWRRIDDARKKYGIIAEQNVLVVSREMSNGEFVEEVAHSGFKDRIKNGESIDGTIKKAGEKNFNQFQVGGHRLQDSESKFFEYLLEQLDKGIVKEGDIKRLFLYTERPVCPSCLNVIREFKKKHNIEIIVYEGKYRR